MPATYEPIASTTLGSSASQIDFSSISGSFTDLRIILNVAKLSSGFANVLMRFNADTTSVYSGTFLHGDGSAAGSARSSGAAFIYCSYTTNLSSTYTQECIIDVQSYANTNVFKTALINSTSSGSGVERVAGLWRSTSAITAVRLYLSGGSSLPAGTSAALYGIKAA